MRPSGGVGPETERRGPDRGVISRRDVIRRGAIAGGVVWAAPAILSLDRAVAGTPRTCDCTFCATVTPPRGPKLYFDCKGATDDDCNCLCVCGHVTGVPCSHLSDPCTVAITCTPRATPC